MGKSEQQVVEILVTLLEANITDPATGRAAIPKKWIYDDLPREDITSTPRIGVYPAGSTYTNVAVGYTQQLEEGVIEIQIITKKTDKFGGLRAEQLVDDLGIKVRNLIRTNHDLFITNEIQHLVPETKNRSELDGLVIESMTFKYVSVN